MIEIKIAIPTDDGEKVCSKMFGMAAFYLIYECDSGKLKLIEKKVNPYAKEMPRGKTFYVIEVLRDCDVYVVSSIGARGRRRVLEKGITIYDVEKGIDISIVLKRIELELCGGHAVGRV